MLVRSQDNKKITEIINFATMGDEEGRFTIYHVETGKPYGEYDSLDDAIKALDMMESAYRNGKKVFQMPAEEELDSERGAICPHCGGTNTQFSEETDSWGCEDCEKTF